LKINNIYFVNIFTVQNWDYYRLTNLFLYGDTPFWGGLWFFQAYIYGLIIMLILAVVFKNKLFKKRAMVFLMAVMFCLFSYCSIYMAYYKTCVLGENILSVWYRNWLFFGLPFIFVGFFVARFRSKLVQIPGKIIIPLSVVLFVLLYFENWISRLKLGASTDDSAHDMDFILIFLVPVLLILFCKFPLDKIKILNTKLFRYASASSLYVDIYHLMIIYSLISKNIFNHFEMYFGLLITVGIYVFITLLGVVYLELKSGIKLFINHKNFQ
ncbi:MAG: acyltransferase family protein, partial [Candidatus Ancillula sp.]|nr:acyltransferase family protein [Candidatus Ancillula sp.]